MENSQLAFDFDSFLTEEEATHVSSLGLSQKYEYISVLVIRIMTRNLSSITKGFNLPYEKSIDWFFDSDSQGIFSIESISDCLGVSANSIRFEAINAVKNKIKTTTKDDSRKTLTERLEFLTEKHKLCLE